MHRILMASALIRTPTLRKKTRRRLMRTLGLPSTPSGAGSTGRTMLPGEQETKLFMPKKSF